MLFGTFCTASSTLVVPGPQRSIISDILYVSFPIQVDRSLLTGLFCNTGINIQGENMLKVHEFLKNLLKRVLQWKRILYEQGQGVKLSSGPRTITGPHSQFSCSFFFFLSESTNWTLKNLYLCFTKHSAVSIYLYVTGISGRQCVRHHLL